MMQPSRVTNNTSATTSRVEGTTSPSAKMSVARAAAMMAVIAASLLLAHTDGVQGQTVECRNSERVNACLLEVEDSSVYTFNSFNPIYNFARMAIDQVVGSPEPYSTSCCKKYTGPVSKNLQYKGLMSVCNGLRAQAANSEIDLCTPTVYISKSPDQRMLSAFNNRNSPVVLSNPMNVTQKRYIRHLRLEPDSPLQLQLRGNKSFHFEDYMAAPLEERKGNLNVAARYLTDTLLQSNNGTATSIDKALKRLARFDFVGVEGDIATEARMMQLFSYRFSLDLIVFYSLQRWNWMKDILVEKPELASQISAENALDAKLHTIASGRFEDDFARMPEKEKTWSFTCGVQRVCFNQSAYMNASHRIKNLQQQMKSMLQLERKAKQQQALSGGTKQSQSQGQRQVSTDSPVEPTHGLKRRSLLSGSADAMEHFGERMKKRYGGGHHRFDPARARDFMERFGGSHGEGGDGNGTGNPLNQWSRRGNMQGMNNMGAGNSVNGRQQYSRGQSQGDRIPRIDLERVQAKLQKMKTTLEGLDKALSSHFTRVTKVVEETENSDADHEKEIVLNDIYCIRRCVR